MTLRAQALPRPAHAAGAGRPHGLDIGARMTSGSATNSAPEPPSEVDATKWDPALPTTPVRAWRASRPQGT